MLCRRLGLQGARMLQTSTPACSRQEDRIAVENADRLRPEEIWKRRMALRKPILQCDEKLPQKVYYEPDFYSDYIAEQDEDKFDEPRGHSGMTPEKWEHYNKVIWPPNYVVPETGLPKTKEVFHCRESVHYAPKKIFPVCWFVRKLNVDYAIQQCKLINLKGPLIMASVLEDVKARASDEFHIEHPGQMYVADAFAIQCMIIKGARRHAHEQWHPRRYRYVNIFVRLEDGPPPFTKKRFGDKDGWEKAREYVDYLHSRSVKYGL